MFLGPYGTIFPIVLLPFLVIFLQNWVDHPTLPTQVWTSLCQWPKGLDALYTLLFEKSATEWKFTSIIIGWFGFQLALSILVPGYAKA